MERVLNSIKSNTRIINSAMQLVYEEKGALLLGFLVSMNIIVNYSIEIKYFNKTFLFKILTIPIFIM